ncbi:DUF3857 and transglutaminase domain-containing protein [Nitrospirillum sp. BR 11828]|uniref:DUF3857 domain-containing transglutaminase family protein n=1 Tax=Nitrospirillum sp. BR 11828 TaxID=3104325 RepID=UPI002ACA07FF|nr:DUF3857 and transglutaminase domain-containing protein [Nitrospirillum sp. BR 11828]MDZ5648334.1 DUF3857 and transglutaminase domain-containing protein [Nitrospirillum sp. BR 11828]
MGTSKKVMWALLAGAMGTPLTAAQAAEKPIEWKESSAEIIVERDGTYTKTGHLELLAKTTAAAHNMGQMSEYYSENLEDLDIVDAYTLKADGRKLPVDVSAILTQAAPGAANVPLFSDLKMKTIIFPDVAAGDTVAYTARHHVKVPFFKGQFTDNVTFPPTWLVRDERATISLPRDMPLAIDAHGISITQETAGDRILYRWQYSNPDPLTEDLAAVSQKDRGTRFFVSTFKDYDSLAKAYAAETAATETVTPKIQAKADEITAGVTDKRQQAETLYAWVSTHIRYVGLEFGRNGIIPHAAEAILTNGYGDCKDHAALFGALLKAKGIASELVLINSGNGYSLPTAPTFAQFDHVISWLPEFHLYVDTTAMVAPFGVLPFSEYGKPVLHVVSTGGAVRQVPILPAGSSLKVVATAKMDATGAITGTMDSEANGPFSIGLRETAQNAQAQGPDRMAAEYLQAWGWAGTGTYAVNQSPLDLSASYRIGGTYSADPKPEMLTGAGFAPPNGLEIVRPIGDLLMGDLNIPRIKDTEPTPCYTGHMEETRSLELPAGYTVTRLPGDATIADDHLKYVSQWSQKGQVVTVRRTFDTHVDQALCTGDVRKSAAKALLAIAADQRATISLMPVNANGH